jgi:hypothetical protein
LALMRAMPAAAGWTTAFGHAAGGMSGGNEVLPRWAAICGRLRFGDAFWISR